MRQVPRTALRAAAAAALVLPALAFAQDPAKDAAGGANPKSPPPHTGSLLLEALPPGTDMIVQTPNLPRFLHSAVEAGLGTGDAWRAAFREQLRRWGGTEGAERLQRGGETLLAMADGEALLASIELPKVGSSPRVRSILLGFRSSKTEAELRAAVDDVVEGGLRRRWPDPPQTEKSAGRPVLALTGPHDGLWIRVQDGVVLASDQSLTLVLMFRGLDRVAKSGGPQAESPGERLVVRWGPKDARWLGSTFLQREAASSLAGTAFPTTTLRPPADAVAFACLDAVSDVPIFPLRATEDFVAQSTARGRLPPFVAALLGNGEFALLDPGPQPEGTAPAAGGAGHLGWMRAMVAGKLPCPVPAVDPEVLAAPLAAAAAATKDAPAVHEWSPTDQTGEVRGPAWHGPATMLALRAVGEIARGVAPGFAPEGPAAAPPKPTAPPPPPPPKPPR
jgi:hypothetical protein